MDKHAVALVLEEIATLLDVSGDNRFKARAFRTAARAVDRLQDDIAALVRAGTLTDVSGIGPATARVIEELVLHGSSPYLAALRKREPAGLRELLRVPGLGPQRIATLHSELGIADLDALEAAARSGAIVGVRGFGPQTQQRILDGIAFARGAGERRRFHQIEPVAERVLALVGALPGVSRASLAGELRRCLETVDRISVVAAISSGRRDAALDALQRGPGIVWRRPAPAQLQGRLGDGVLLDLFLVEPAAFAAALLVHTGSEAHLGALRQRAADNDMALDADGLRSDGRRIRADDEAAIYTRLGLEWVPPELREGRDELELAARGALPQLIRYEDLRGCFHCHTTWSDGRAPVHEMAEAALALGWSYLGIADHSQNASYAGGLSPRQLAAQRREIMAWNRERGDELWLFAGVEADIMPDGSLDYAAQGDDATLDRLDFVVASVHSAFRMPRREMTARVRRALDDPRLTMLGHMTGRLLLTRDGYEIDIDAVIEHAAHTGAAIEINADPHRLDLSWQYWPPARSLGVRTAINPDAHSAGALQNVRYGVNIARKAGLAPAAVVNAWPLQDVRDFLAARKQRTDS